MPKAFWIDLDLADWGLLDDQIRRHVRGSARATSYPEINMTTAITKDDKGRHHLVLEVGVREYAVIPGSPKKCLIGPGKLEIIRYPDGRVFGQILDGKLYETSLAVDHKLKRLSWGI